jgi:DNA-binding MarR family transcriptional regulator
MLNDEIRVSMSLLYKHNLTLESFLILVCLHNNDPRPLEKYVVNCRVIPSSILKSLIDKGYIVISDSADVNKLTFKQMALTEKGSGLFPSTKFTELFKQFKDLYPKKVVTRFGEVRRLHLDMKRAERLYESLIVSGGKCDIDLHNNIMLATKKMLEEKQSSPDGLKFLQNVATYLHQKNYEAYMIDDGDEVSKTNITNIDAV